MALKIHSAGVDPQNGFTQIGDLVCPGGYEAISRVANLHERMGKRITSIDISMDQHHKIDISHPGWFRKKNGAQIDKFTEVSAQDLIDGTYTVFHPAVHRRTLKYLQDLEAESLRRGRPRKHMVWPEHCLIGSEQAVIQNNLLEVLYDWTELTGKNFTPVSKGSNLFTEHFSVVKAMVPNEDPSTHVNTDFVGKVEKADITLIWGLALSHCVAETGYDLMEEFQNSDTVKKLVLLTDGTVSVKGCESLGNDFVSTFKKAGGQTMDCAQFIKQYA